MVIVQRSSCETHDDKRLEGVDGDCQEIYTSSLLNHFPMATRDIGYIRSVSKKVHHREPLVNIPPK